MIKSRFAQFLDTCLFVLGLSIIMFAWINKFVKISLYSFIITAVVSFVLAKIIWDKTTKKYNKKKLKSDEIKFAQNCIDYLSLHPQECLQFFSKIVKDSTIKNNYIISNNELYFFDYSSEITTTATLAYLLKQPFKKCYLFSSKLSTKAEQLLIQTNIVWIKDYDCYLLMKENNIYPITEQKSAKINKNRLKTAIKQSICKKKAKPYFLYGVLLLATSFIMPYSFLYCFIGSVSVIMALVCLLVKNQEEAPKPLS